MTPEDLKKIREAAEAATPGDLDTVNDPTDEHSDRSESDYYECPACQGQGEIDGVTYTNFDHVAIGVQFFGIGNEHVNYERFFRLLKPETVIQLVDEVEQARDWVNTVRRACREAMGNNSTFIDDDVARTIERLTKELAEAREALAPFAQMAKRADFYIEEVCPSLTWPVDGTKFLDGPGFYTVDASDFRRAAKIAGDRADD